MLAGTLPLRYFSESFAHKVPAWRLSGSGHVALFLSLGSWFGVVLVLCLLLWVVLVFAWLEVLVEALKSPTIQKNTSTHLLDRLFRGSKFVLGFGRGFGILTFLIPVFLMLSF